MADWSSLQSGLVNGFNIGQKTGGRFSGIGTAISQVAEALKNQEAQKSELAQKQNLLGYSGLTEGKIVKAEQGESGAFNVPGMGWMKKAPSDTTVYDTVKDENGNSKLVAVGKMADKGKLLGQGVGAASVKFANDNAPSIATALEGGDVAGYENANANTRTAVAKILADKGVKIDDSVLGYKANKSMMTDAKVQDNKVNTANNLMKVFNTNYDSKTDTYKITPSQHYELALGYAKMINQNGVVSQQSAEELRQHTAREGLAGAAIYLGVPPNIAGGPPQELIKYFRDNIDAQAKQAVEARTSYQSGKVNDYQGIKSGSNYKPIKSGQNNNDPEYQKYLKAIGQ